MHALALEGVEHAGERGDQRLAFAGLHLRDLALVQDDAADQLHVVVPHSEGALGGGAGQGERLEEDVVEALTVLDLLLELTDAASNAVVVELLDVRLEVVDGGHHGAELLERPLVLGAEDFLQDVLKHGVSGPPSDGLGAAGWRA